MTTARMLATRHLSLLVFDHRMDLRNRPLLCMSTGSPKVLGDPARVLSRLRPLARGQRGGGPRTYPGPVHRLGRPLVVSCFRLSGGPGAAEGLGSGGSVPGGRRLGPGQARPLTTRR
jgi:hypothetical protein